MAQQRGEPRLTRAEAGSGGPCEASVSDGEPREASGSVAGGIAGPGVAQPVARAERETVGEQEGSPGRMDEDMHPVTEAGAKGPDGWRQQFRQLCEVRVCGRPREPLP